MWTNDDEGDEIKDALQLQTNIQGAQNATQQDDNYYKITHGRERHTMMVLARPVSCAWRR